MEDHLWHFRLGHPSFDRLSVIQSLDPKVSCKKYSYCDVCMQAKQKRLPFPVKCKNSISILELLHCDLWGPYTVAALNKHHYFLTIVDDYSRFTWVYLLKHKSETKSVLSNFITMIQTQMHKNVKMIRTYNGMEFHMPELLNKYGILHQKTCAYTPQQNGVLERKH